MPSKRISTEGIALLIAMYSCSKSEGVIGHDLVCCRRLIMQDGDNDMLSSADESDDAK